MTEANLVPNLMLLIARICLAALFLYSGATKLIGFAEAAQEFAALRLPMPALASAATIAIQRGAGALLLAGTFPMPAALVLALFTVAATLIGHPFWTFEGATFQRQLTTGLVNLAMVGRLLLIAATGPGRFALRSGPVWS